MDFVIFKVKVLITSFIFAKETVNPSLTSAAPDSSQNFTPGDKKITRKLLFSS
jgi:hypothetical protein